VQTELIVKGRSDIVDIRAATFHGEATGASLIALMVDRLIRSPV
jgi:hypothetical protein